MLHVAVETKQLPARREHRSQITRYVDVIEGNEVSSENEKDTDEEELEKLVFGASCDASISSHVEKKKKRTRKRKAPKRKAPKEGSESDENDDSESAVQDAQKEPEPKRKAAREDSESESDDDNSELPVQQAKKDHGTEEKAAEDDSESEDDDPELPVHQTQKKPAWQDEDDNGLPIEEKEGHTDLPTNKTGGKTDEYSEQLKKRYTKIMGVPKWAEQNDAEKGSDDENSDDLLRKATKFVGKSTNLAPNILQIHKCTPLAFESRETTLLKNVEFHPSSQVALTAGLSGTVTICQVSQYFSSILLLVPTAKFCSTW